MIFLVTTPFSHIILDLLLWLSDSVEKVRLETLIVALSDKKFIFHLYNWKVHYHIHDSLSLVIWRVRSIRHTPYFFEINFNVVLACELSPSSSKQILSLRNIPVVSSHLCLGLLSPHSFVICEFLDSHTTPPHSIVLIVSIVLALFLEKCVVQVVKSLKTLFSSSVCLPK
jgi:hypothetical protein